MDLWIYGEDFTRVGIVDTASSIIWTDRFRQCGDFEIYIRATTDMLDLLQIDRYVVRDDSDMVGIIEKLEIVTDVESGDHIIATGRCLRSILDRRIVWQQTVLSDTVENGLRKLVTDAFINSSIKSRNYDGLVLAAAHGYTETIYAQYTGTVLLEAIEEICAAHNIGFKITLKGGVMTLDFYKAVNRSADQDDVPRVIFSEELDTVNASTYVRDKTGYKNHVQVAGEGEGNARIIYYFTNPAVGNTGGGLKRREMFVDARDISSNEGEIDHSAYLDLLYARGLEKMAEATEVTSLSGTVETSKTYTYGTDYSLGDIVSVINKYGLQTNAQVLEVMEKWDENGYECMPTFG